MKKCSDVPSIERMREEVAQCSPIWRASIESGSVDNATVRAVWDGLQASNRVREERLRAGDFEGYLFTFGGHERLAPFREMQERMPDRDFWRCLAFAWDNIEVSSPNVREWLGWFESKRPGREALMTAEECSALESLPDEVEVFRGYASGKVRRGLSWTLSEEVALRFATYATSGRRAMFCGHATGGPGAVASGRVRKNDILAHFLGRKELEIIVNPAHVRGIRSRKIESA